MQAIDIRKTGKVIDELERELRTLSGLQERVQDVYRRFPQVMDHPTIRRSLKNQISGLEREKLGYRKLAATLEQVNTLYETSENRITTYAEEVSAKKKVPLICTVVIPRWLFALVR
ncbi:MAG: hypothetical protein LIO96_09395 [Lachnospiraceae bacterium]|nr:hypothetical protein [Lachnospiraceae bacterium]